MKTSIKQLGISFFSGLILTGSFAVANSLESENIKVEAENWKKEIEKWDALHENWSEKRENYYEENFQNFSRRHGKYCDGSGCFEEGIFALEYKNANKEFRITSIGNNTITIGNIIFSQFNGGQSLEVKNIKTNEQWESVNFGQRLEYKNELGSIWENNNYGQSIRFNGASGEQWESFNFGQSLNFTDKNGNTWSSSNFGQSVQNNNESVDFDIQDELFNY